MSDATFISNGTDSVDCLAEEARDVSGDNTGKRISSQTAWMYQCMIYECFASFQRLDDLRIHFIDTHQSGNNRA